MYLKKILFQFFGLADAVSSDDLLTFLEATERDIHAQLDCLYGMLEVEYAAENINYEKVDALNAQIGKINHDWSELKSRNMSFLKNKAKRVSV